MTELALRIARRVRNNLPPQELTIESSMTPEELATRLAAATDDRRRWITKPEPTKPFQGRVDGLSLELVRAIRYRNSFLPIIKGRIEAGDRGSRLTATMRLHPFVVGFEVLWFGFFGLFAALIVVGIATGGRLGHAWLLLVPMAFFGFGVGLLMTSFGPEARRARGVLESIASGNPPPAVQEAWFEATDNLSWRDIRRAGLLGYLAVLSYPVTAGLALLTWTGWFGWFGRIGCFHPESLDPTVYCPAGWRVVSV